MGILKGNAETITVGIVAKITDVTIPGNSFLLKFTAEFKRRDYDDAQKLIAQINDPQSDVSEAQVIRDDLLGWSGLEGDGGPVEFTPENVAICIQHPEYRLALFNGWGSAQLRRLLANSKN